MVSSTELRITIPALRQKLNELANKFSIPLDAPSLFKNELDFDGLKSGESVPEINDCSEIEEEVPVILFILRALWRKDQIMARKYFKEAADDYNFFDAQCKYAVSLLGGLCKETDVAAKDKFYDKIIRYFELAANNPKYRYLDVMYYLGDIYAN
ncbi:hypothetical protein F8M41_021098 [Gigaspora margarita]|uniref:Uncharacterized protein n=1 Tax=Gigaspora margarita TaxID=4874 RepID=A0A8H4AHD3_GIGMA|nr:hypothetical protein F8M41_021098 [Gigaspora margarita]